MFNFGYESYMKYAFPKDELRPISCSGMETWGNYSLTLIGIIIFNLKRFTRFFGNIWELFRI
jgi:hypothetical protein